MELLLMARHAAARASIGFAAVLALGAAASSACAQSWPAKPVTIVVGVPAGGALDPFARAFADQLQRQTGGTFIVDNKPGANGNLSAEAVLKQPADGTVLWVGTQAMLAINPSAFPALRWKPSDFVPIVKAVEAPLVLVSNASSVPARDFGSLTRWIADPRNKAAYASFSPGTPSHFLGFQLNERLKASMVHVPYKGSGQQVTDIVGGQVPLGFAQLAAALPHVRSGRLNAVAVTGPARSRFLPEVPTLGELGHKDLETTVWFGVFVAAGTPPPLVQAIRAAARKAQADPAYRSRIDALGFDIPEVSPAAFQSDIAAEGARWAALVKATGFRATD